MTRIRIYTEIEFAGSVDEIADKASAVLADIAAYNWSVAEYDEHGIVCEAPIEDWNTTA